MKLSVIALWITGLILLISVIYLIYALASKTGEPLTKYEIAMLLIYVTIAVALFTFAYCYAEVNLGFTYFEPSEKSEKLVDLETMQRNLAQGYNSLMDKIRGVPRNA